MADFRKKKGTYMRCHKAFVIRFDFRYNVLPHHPRSSEGESLWNFTNILAED